MNRYDPLEIERKWQQKWSSDKSNSPLTTTYNSAELEIINNGYGEDTLKTYEMFVGPITPNTAYKPSEVGGVYRFLNRCWTLVFDDKNKALDSQFGAMRSAAARELASSARGRLSEESSEERTSSFFRDDDRLATLVDGSDGRGPERETNALSIRHHTIKKVTTDLEKQKFNTAISALMQYVNELYKTGASRDDLVALAKLLKPFAPHLASEMLEHLDADDAWPTWDDKYLISNLITLVVQVNGKLRATLTVNVDDLDDEQKILNLALADKKIQKCTESGIKKTIYVKKAKLLNLVI